MSAHIAGYSRSQGVAQKVNGNIVMKNLQTQRHVLSIYRPRIPYIRCGAIDKAKCGFNLAISGIFPKSRYRREISPSDRVWAYPYPCSAMAFLRRGFSTAQILMRGKDLDWAEHSQDLVISNLKTALRSSRKCLKIERKRYLLLKVHSMVIIFQILFKLDSRKFQIWE